jgi:CarboxypepD_reg-like domain/BAAT / Acyl-CoA thioester hydrolase C terminal
LNYRLLILLVLLPGIEVFAQTVPKQDSIYLYNAGYQSIVLTDSNRNYKSGVPISNRLYYRPVEIDLWYPAIHSKSKLPIQYGVFLNLLEQRSNRFQEDTIYKNLTAELIHYLSVNLGIPDSALIHLKTSSYLNAEAIQQPFPLILYMCAYNGMSYENLRLFEFLAAHGYIVACITSVGRYPGDMSTKPGDLMEQVNDGFFVMNYLKPRVYIDSTKIGAIGYSWGGLAALLLSLKTPDVKAVLSLDGSEMHYFGESKEEDKDFDDLRNSSSFHLQNMNAAYIYLESGFKQNDREVDSIFNILPLIGHPKQYIHFPKATHEDFSFLSSLGSRNSRINNDNRSLYSQIRDLVLGYFDKYLKNENNLALQQTSLIYQQHMGDSIYPVLKIDNKKIIIIKGKVVDMEKNEALPYVNVGINNKNIGTVTQRDGSFHLNIDSAFISDSLTISMAGYQGQTLNISHLIKQSKPIIIPLKEKFSALEEVVITKRTLPIKIVGNTTTSKFISVGLPLKFLGSEVGVKIQLGKHPVILKKFSFNVSDTRLDTAVFRMNIYNLKNGIPFENILHKNVLIPVGKQTGLYTINLTEYKLEMKGEILLSLEWIEGSSSASTNGAIFLSAGFLNSNTWHRITSQGEWKKAPGLGVGLNMEVQKLPAP